MFLRTVSCQILLITILFHTQVLYAGLLDDLTKKLEDVRQAAKPITDTVNKATNTPASAPLKSPVESGSLSPVAQSSPVDSATSTVSGVLMMKLFSASYVDARITGNPKKDETAVQMELVNAVRSDGAPNDCVTYILDRFGTKESLTGAVQEYSILTGGVVQLDNVRASAVKSKCLFSKLVGVKTDPFVTEVTGIATLPGTTDLSNTIRIVPVSPKPKPSVSRMMVLRDAQASQPGWNICTQFHSQEFTGNAEDIKKELAKTPALDGKRIRLTQVTRGKLNGYCLFENYEVLSEAAPSVAQKSSPETFKPVEGMSLNDHTAKLVRIYGGILFLDQNEVSISGQLRQCRHYLSPKYTPNDLARMKDLVNKRVTLKNVRYGKAGACEFDDVQVATDGVSSRTPVNPQPETKKPGASTQSDELAILRIVRDRRVDVTGHSLQNSNLICRYIEVNENLTEADWQRIRGLVGKKVVLKNVRRPSPIESKCIIDDIQAAPNGP